MPGEDAGAQLAAVAIERRGDYVLFELSANAFLHHMVRNVVGSLVYVGKGAAPAEWVAEVLAGRDRSRAAPTFAPEGLYLAGVAYPERWKLPAFPPMLPFAGAKAIRTRVKICGITSPGDGAAAARHGADAIGLVFYPPSPRLVGRASVRARSSAALPPFVARVAVFVNPSRPKSRRSFAGADRTSSSFTARKRPSSAGRSGCRTCGRCA